MDRFFSVVLGTGVALAMVAGLPNVRFPKTILSVVDEPTSVSDRVASARPAFPDLNGMF